MLKDESIDSLLEAQVLIKKKYEIVRFQENLGIGQIFTTGGERYLLMFKREYYENFNNHFPQLIKNDGSTYEKAQIINRKILLRALSRNVIWIIFATPDKKLYKCRAKLFYRYSKKHKTDVPHLQGEISLPLEFFEEL